MKSFTNVLFLSIFLVGSITSQAENSFNRESTLAAFKDQCQLSLVLAMGLSAQKESGKSQAELTNVAKTSKSPDLMVPMVTELFGKPEIQGRTFTFFSFDNCLISKSLSNTPVALNEVRDELKKCESTHQDMEGLIQCIDSTIISNQKKS